MTLSLKRTVYYKGKSMKNFMSTLILMILIGGWGSPLAADDFTIILDDGTIHHGQYPVSEPRTAVIVGP